MITIGHRGCKNDVPENTLSAVEYASSYVDVVEIDVRRCGSGELVCVHDSGLASLTGYRGAVSETSWDVVRDLTVGDSGETVPKFDAVLAQWPENVGLNVDIKGRNVLSDVLDRLDGASVDGPVILSMERDILPELPADPDPDPMLGLSFSEEFEENIRTAASHGFDYIHVPCALCLETDVVKHAHTTDLLVDAYSIDDESVFDRLEREGVDAVTVNSCNLG